MEIFNAIGLQLPKGETLNDLAAAAEKHGDASIYERPNCVLYGRCWHIGAGLEVWTIIYEAENGETFYADCRPGFRAKYTQTVENWSLYEDHKEGEAAIRGRIGKCDTEIFFQLQNLTEVSAQNFDGETLCVGISGLAIGAEVLTTEESLVWQPLRENSEKPKIEQSYQSLCGRILAFESFRNPHSKTNLHWIYLALKDFNLEILVNRKDLRGSALRVGLYVRADVWLQGHIVSRSTYYSNYEGVDRFAPTVNFWKHFKRQN